MAKQCFSVFLLVLVVFGSSTLVCGGSPTDLKGQAIPTPSKTIQSKVPEEKTPSVTPPASFKKEGKKPGVPTPSIRTPKEGDKSLVPNHGPVLVIQDVYLKEGILHVKIQNQGKGRVSATAYAKAKLHVAPQDVKIPWSWSLMKVDPKRSSFIRGVDFDTGKAITGQTAIRAWLEHVPTSGEWKGALGPLIRLSKGRMHVPPSEAGKALTSGTKKKPTGPEKGLRPLISSGGIQRPSLDLSEERTGGIHPGLSREGMRIYSSDAGVHEGIIVLSPRRGHHYGFDASIPVRFEFEGDPRPPWVKVSLRKGSDPQAFYTSPKLSVTREDMEHSIDLGLLHLALRDFTGGSDYYIYVSGPGLGENAPPIYGMGSPFTLGEPPSLPTITSTSTPIIVGRPMDIHGAHLGPEPGRVSIRLEEDGRTEVYPCPVLAWDEEAIRCVVSTELTGIIGNHPQRGGLSVEPLGSVSARRVPVRVQPLAGDSGGSGAPELDQFWFYVDRFHINESRNDILSTRHFEREIRLYLSVEDDDLITHVEVLFDSHPVFHDTPNTVSFENMALPMDLSPYRPASSGLHSFEIVARDEHGNELRKQWPVFVDVDPPVLNVQHPSDGSTVETPLVGGRGEISFNIRAEDVGSGIHWVRVGLSDGQAGTPQVRYAPPFHFVLPMPPAGESVFLIESGDYASNLVEREIRVTVTD